MAEQTTKEVEADRDYWLTLEKYLPWKLYGFTYRRKASFLNKNGDIIYLNPIQFAEIIEAVENGQKA
jgi:hypothetical protein